MQKTSGIDSHITFEELGIIAKEDCNILRIIRKAIEIVKLERNA